MPPALSFAEARALVLDRSRAISRERSTEAVSLLHARGRVLASAISADRDYPATARSVRDGFAVRSQDVPGRLRVIGETRAGAEAFDGVVGPGEAVEIMTGAPMPLGADAVVMVEFAVRDGDNVTFDRGAKSGENFNPRGCEARQSAVVIPAGARIDHTTIALLATYGMPEVSVYTKPSVAILATGDELVAIEETPADFQIRNSNSYSIAAQVDRAGCVARILPVARDSYDATRGLIEEGLAADMLLLSGGVSAGKYDIVEQVLADLGAEFHFTRVKIQPGQPLVFGSVRDKLFFGLPGNPASTMVTFELFARWALEILSGMAAAPALPFSWAKLAHDFRHRPGLTRFLPAVVDGQGGVTQVPWAGSSDVPSMARANAFLVADSDREQYRQGVLIQVLAK